MKFYMCIGIGMTSYGIVNKQYSVICTVMATDKCQKFVSMPQLGGLSASSNKMKWPNNQ